MEPGTNNRAQAGDTMPPATPRAAGLTRRLCRWVGVLLLMYLAVAYVALPMAWRSRMSRHPDLSGGPRITHTKNGIPGDPVNLALVGSESELVKAMTGAGWSPADPITLRSSLRIAEASILRRPDKDAPVSDLFLFGRKQELAFEEPVGDSPRQRHHVRFWHWDEQWQGREVWFGAATFDTRVGFSHTTGQVTHHIGPDVDAEREKILKGLELSKAVQEIYYVDGFHTETQGRNGGGDEWHTDGRLGVALLGPAGNRPVGGTNSTDKVTSWTGQERGKRKGQVL